ncbi:hypothetical protein M501DRAFT_593988 [Patellaria atrata CBS 101060]|uniref:Uncharacterized protein n=1 Tax=Patellaria atrata CBS 101060 TaxID=1346257 RepID=A0A9P4S132_9PEZI|nr:hypothetical protein M501DRAFT_593988 [Patellaria atrata CBS 101060]
MDALYPPHERQDVAICFLTLVLKVVGNCILTARLSTKSPSSNSEHRLRNSRPSDLRRDLGNIRISSLTVIVGMSAFFLLVR